MATAQGAVGVESFDAVARRTDPPAADHETVERVGSGRPAVEIRTADDMRRLGVRLAAQLRAGDLVLLRGPLGAGKTTLAQGIGEGLDVRGPITSPTFVLARVHPARSGGPPLVHVDAYRLTDWDDLETLDLEATLDEAVTVVEWGEGLVEGLADDRLEVRIERAPAAPADGGDDARIVTIAAVGERWRGIAPAWLA
ncbi:MAG TPA: tRNA (adenosine(37)-N6)-threonylcarbamoyltransferase complex ATPase subunit type 1 TsaE [Jiangellales bacterium]|nr:tRNA (adenosine(37)-N6)-threonylcarbamoyltransferase complex ATPase subunit type 1 TsaE [Jiangellales bacterium]